MTFNGKTVTKIGRGSKNSRLYFDDGTNLLVKNEVLVSGQQDIQVEVAVPKQKASPGARHGTSFEPIPDFFELNKQLNHETPLTTNSRGVYWIDILNLRDKYEGREEAPEVRSRDDYNFTPDFLKEDPAE